ncbi:MAG: hypothetical protein BroJett040_11620 [Oligoflexia bacterium]|nr:MAG: hypothetical protein BroJett040_11620 [Oligoflexia bacterium]
MSVAKTASEIQKTYNHIQNEKRCLNCHITTSGPELKMLTGEKLTKAQVPQLCGQCHGLVKRDWDHAMHGKKVDSWKLTGRKLLCTECHDSHDPKFKTMKAVPPPKRPTLGIEKDEKHGKH